MKKLILIFMLSSSICHGMNVSYTINSINQQGVTILKHNVDINAPFQINSSNVTLDMNGKTVRGGILINSGLRNITIKNGIVDPTTTTTQAAIHAKAGCENIQLIDLKIRSAQRGIFFETVSDSLIENCELTATTSAVVLSRCSNVVLDSVLAQNNLNAGFSLLTSTTCLLRDCKAINTGLGNTTVLNNTVIGFAASNGFGNIFERCISNATQALSTTDFDSVVAGFALRGTERCSKIIECEASNAGVSSTGVTTPYGILLERIINPSLLTTTTAFVATGVNFNSVSWSPDGALFAGGEEGTSNKSLYIFEFDRPNATTIRLASLGGFDAISSVDWAPMNDYIALAANGVGTGDVFIIKFERVNDTLTIVNSADVAPNSPIALEWRLDGRYIAVADNGDNLVRIYKFDSVAQTLSQVVTSTTLANPVSVAWSPDGDFVAVADDGSNLVLIFEFQSATNTLTLRATSNAAANPVAIDWSPDGTFIAVGDDTDDELYIYQFDQTTNSLSVVATTAGASRRPRDPQSVVWSPDSAYIAVPENPSGMFTASTILIYKFDRGSNRLIFTIEVLNDVPDGPKEADWSPDGQNILLADTQDPNKGIFVYEAWTYPPKNLVKDSVVYCNSGGKFSQGVGISGSSIANMIIQNTAYTNSLVTTSTNSQLVPTNYIFVPNVFNQLFGQGPTELQNIALAYNEPICMPEDLALIIKQVQFEITFVDSQLDIISGNMSNLQNTLDTLISCTILPIVAANIPTTITQSGVYCLADDVNYSGITPAIDIQANNVTIDLNNHTITLLGGSANGIMIAGRNYVVIQNGTIEDTSGVVNALDINNSSNVVIDQVNANNALAGIFMGNVINGLVSKCRLSRNFQGFVSSNVHSIIVKDTIASENIVNGYSMDLSSTCCFRDCKALSTGFNNSTVSGAIITGFESENGYGNIFERCIANATHALSATDSNSIIAGFALLGTEQCTKIIACEACNTITSTVGVTVPYGILLQAQFDGLVSVTSVNPNAGSTSDVVRSVAWSPDGKYLAVGDEMDGTIRDNLFIYMFDYTTQALIQVASAEVNSGSTLDSVLSVAWSPNGRYLALGGNFIGGALRVYGFDRDNNTLSQMQSTNPGGAETDIIHTVAWSPDGNYIALGGDITGDALYVYAFNIVHQTISQVDSVDTGGAGDIVRSVDWSPDGRYLAVGGTLTGNDLRAYSFDRGTQTLTEIASVNPGGGAADTVYVVAWSPNGKYLAVGGDINFPYPGNDLYVYRFNPVAATPLTEIVSVNPGSMADSDWIFTLDWSPDGNYLAVAGFIYGAVTSHLYIYSFDPGAPMLFEEDAVNPDEGGDDFVFSVAWSPDGQYLAVGGQIAGVTNFDVIIYSALVFPSRNVIKDNVVYCNSGGDPLGIGISGSSIANLIIGNTAYSNPLYLQGSGRTQVIPPTNYAFVCNALDSQFGLDLSLVQNAAIDSYQPFPIAENVARLLKKDIAKVIALGVCGGNSITLDNVEGGTLGAVGTVFLSASGNYCLGENIIADILISTTCVELNLNNHCLTGRVIVQTAQNVVIENGIIEAASGGGLSPAGALDIANSVVNIIVRNVQITTGNAGNSNSGRPGITTAGYNVTIQNCIINTGNGSAADGIVAHGGVGISVGASSARTIIRDCTIATGNGNRGTTPGDGGNGIHVLNGASGVEIINCLVQKTGNGGDDTNTAAGGGNAGHGIQIDTSAIDTAVANCIIRNTGSAGTGTSSSTGVAGKAVNDRVTIAANLSQVFSNFAHNIANATKFDIQAAGVETGIMTPNPPTATPINPFANVFS